MLNQQEYFPSNECVHHPDCPIPVNGSLVRFDTSNSLFSVPPELTKHLGGDQILATFEIPIFAESILYTFFSSEPFRQVESRQGDMFLPAARGPYGPSRTVNLTPVLQTNRTTRSLDHQTGVRRPGVPPLRSQDHTQGSRSLSAQRLRESQLRNITDTYNQLNAPVQRLPHTTLQPRSNGHPVLQDMRLDDTQAPPVATSPVVPTTPGTNNNISVPVSNADQINVTSSREDQPPTDGAKVPPAPPAVPQPQGLRNTDALPQEPSEHLDQPQGAHGGADIIQEHHGDVTHPGVHRDDDHPHDVQRGPPQDQQSGDDGHRTPDQKPTDSKNKSADHLLLQELTPALEKIEYQDFKTYKVTETEYKLPAYLHNFTTNLIKQLRHSQDPAIMSKLFPYIGLDDDNEVQSNPRALNLDNLNCLSALHKLALTKNMHLVNSPLRNKTAQIFRRITTRSHQVQDS